MLVKTEVLEEEDCNIGDISEFGGGGIEREMDQDLKPQEEPDIKQEQPQEFIPSRVRPKLDSRFAKDNTTCDEGGLLRCPKCSITYRSSASMKNHIAVCKAVKKDPNAGSFSYD